MAETQIKDQILTTIREAGFFAEKTHGEAMQTRGIPDIFACIAGSFVGIEVKQPGETASPLQEHHLAEIRKAGGYGVVVDNVAIVEVALKKWLNVCPKCFAALENWSERGYVCPNEHGIMVDGKFQYWGEV